MRLTPGMVDCSNRRLLLLAPSEQHVQGIFTEVEANNAQHAKLTTALQKFRGKIYLKDGALEADQLSSDGRHKLEIDDRSWHLVSVDKNGEVCGCSRYLPHQSTISFRNLEVRNSALAQCNTWGGYLRSAVRKEIEIAHERAFTYAEVGGWALSESLRYTTEALRIALGTYSLAQLLGGCIGITTATVRNASSSILRRIGGHSLKLHDVELPLYYDPQYKCQMEILRFDSSRPNPRYQYWVDEIRSYLKSVPVICPEHHSSWQFVRDAFDLAPQSETRYLKAATA